MPPSGAISRSSKGPPLLYPTPLQVTFKRRRHYLGMHESEEAAARAYDQGAICLLVRRGRGVGGGGVGRVFVGGLVCASSGGVLQAGRQARVWGAERRGAASRQDKIPSSLAQLLTPSVACGVDCQRALHVCGCFRLAQLCLCGPLQGAGAQTNFPLADYDVVSLAALDIADVAARLKALSRGDGGSGRRAPAPGGKRARRVARSAPAPAGLNSDSEETEEETETESEGDSE